MPQSHAPTRQSLRQTLRRARRALDEAARRQKQHAILHTLIRHPRLLAARRIALYWPADGEVDLKALLKLAPHAWRLYLPVLAHGSRLRFAPWNTQTSFRANDYGIPEPQAKRSTFLRPSQLDVVLMPLVGFDDRGNRLGMGGGFYDRSFAFRHARRRWRKPLLIGVAFELQRCPALPTAAWDVPLDGILSERGLTLFHRT